MSNRKTYRQGMYDRGRYEPGKPQFTYPRYVWGRRLIIAGMFLLALSTVALVGALVLR